MFEFDALRIVVQPLKLLVVRLYPEVPFIRPFDRCPRDALAILLDIEICTGSCLYVVASESFKIPLTLCEHGGALNRYWCAIYCANGEARVWGGEGVDGRRRRRLN